jgi:thiamine biosynthesis lipoprotein
MLNTKSWMFAAVASAALSGVAGVRPDLKRYTYAEVHMGTRFRIVLYAADEALAERASRDAFARIATLDAMLSDYRPDSELMQLCKKAGGPPTHVSDELYYVLDYAQKVSRLSDGAFDVTVGPVVRLWRRARKIHELPDPKELAQQRELVGYKNVRLDARAHTVRLLKPGMLLDLGGIAKGYTADEALAVLAKHGITSGLVAAGGDVAVSGSPPDQPAWKVGIASLEDPGRKLQRSLFLHDAAVSTSGDAEQYVEIGGKRYSHIVDPHTGIGLVGRMSVTVVARRGIRADSLTKVVCVLGPARGLPIIEATPDAAALMVRETEHGLELFATNRFAAIPQELSRDGTEPGRR